MTQDPDIFDSDVFADFKAVTQNALRRGLTIHPVKPRDKAPWLTNWPKLASNDSEVITEWCRRFPTSNYGVVANEDFCILESDDVSALSARLSRPIPPTYTVQARLNRPHFYFRQTIASRTAGNMDCPGIFEFKQNNRYVVGEGSIHPTGAVYVGTEEYGIVPIPDDIIHDLQAIRSGRDTRVSAPLPSEGEKLGEGEGRHPMLMSQAAKLWDGDKTREEMFEDLQAVNEQHCDPPKTAAHLLDIIDWIMARSPVSTGPKVEMGMVWGVSVPEAVAFAAEQTPRSPLMTQGDKEVLFYESSVNQIVAWRGLGKTNFALGLAGCFASGGTILEYKAAKPSRVVYVDGELPFLQLCERAGRFCLSPNVFLINPEHIAPKESINLRKSAHLAKLIRAVEKHKADVLILDSQSTLIPGDSIKSEYQEDRMNILREFRWKGLCVIEMHHAGKGDLQRGSSRNDDILDIQIQLRKAGDWEPGQGLKFELAFEKVRHAANLESGFVVTLSPEGKWEKRVSDDQEAVQDALEKGYSISKIAKELDLHTSKVKRLKAKLQKLGLIELNNKTKTGDKK